MKIRRSIAGLAIAVLPMTGIGIALAAPDANASPSCSELQEQEAQLKEDLSGYQTQLDNLEKEQPEGPLEKLIIQLEEAWVNHEIASTNSDLTKNAHAQNTACGASLLGAWLGTWSGPVSQTPSPGFSYDVTISLTSNSGPVVGTDYYSTFSCTGELTLVSVTPQTLVLQETITAQGSSGYTCLDGQITLTATGTGTAEYDWTGSGITATAPLTQEGAPTS
jgi:hypothetical protein